MSVTVNGDLRSGRLKGALEWAAKDVRIFPAHSTDKQGHCTCRDPKCGDPGKHPRIKDWPNLATTDARQIEKWWRRWPSANIVAIAGEAFDAVDIEPQYVEAFKKLGIDLTAYPCHETPRGGLHYFVTAEGLSGQFPGLGEIKGVGGCIHLPPSKIGEGSYREVAELNGNLPRLPKALRDLLVPWNRADKRGPKPSVPVKVTLTKVKRSEKTERSFSRKSRGFHRTDTGNAERLAARHSDALRWCKELGWLYWDGRRWVADDIEADRCAKQTVRAIYSEVADVQDDDERKRLAAWAAQSESAVRIKAMLDRARSEKAITVQTTQLDADLMLLNVRNGTIELKTGKLREHRPGDLITKLAPVDYDPKAHSTLWERFLKEATAGQDGMSDFLRRGVGYTLTGDTREDRLFLEHGPGGAGKSTFINAVRNTLGDYAGSVRIEALTDRAGSGGHNEDVAVLAGKRMVLAVEASESDRLREGLIKTLTGGDQVPASKKYKQVFWFVPQFKLWLATNHVPRIRSDDSGMWRRLLKLPFLNVPKQPDTKLRRTLEADSSHRQAILAWAVRGCLEWQHGGLNPPQCVLFATDQLRRSMDSLDEFFEDCCVFEENASATVQEIRWAYLKWASEQGISERFTVSPNRMAEALQERGCESRRVKSQGKQYRAWTGVAVLEHAKAHGIEVTRK